MSDNVYFGAYCRLDEKSGDTEFELDGNIWSIGSELELFPELHITERGKEVPRVVVGVGDKRAGFVPAREFARLKQCMEDGWVCHAYPSLVAYEKASFYWLEIALVCYDPAHAEAFDKFAAAMQTRIANGERPNVDLSSKQVQHVIESGGSWSEVESLGTPALKKGTVPYKTKTTLAEKAAQGAATGNKGCYVAVVVVLVVIIAIVLFLVLGGR